MKIIILLLFFLAFSVTLLNQEKIVIDSDYTMKEALEGISIPVNIVDNLRLVNVTYYSFDKRLHRGQLVIHKDLVDDIKEIFQVLRNKKFPVEKVIPIVKYKWSDEKSMRDNNTSAFNYRFIKGQDRLSNHATGRAIDINPFLNPQITDGVSYPSGAVYNPKVPGTISVNSLVAKEFKKRGWKWGGNWRTTKDYQHFEKL
jgi:peptidoglycan LD-endopeptidase CwlK